MREPVMGKQGENLYGQWQLCHHHSIRVQTLATPLHSPQISIVCVSRSCHQSSLAEHLLRLDDLPHLPRIATILRTKKNQPSAQAHLVVG